MAQTAGHDAKVEISNSTGQSNGNEISNVKSATLDTPRETLDITGLNTEDIVRIYGREDASVSLDMVKNDGETAQDYLRTAFNDGTQVSVIFYQDGSDKVYFDALVSSFETTSSTGDTVQISCELQGNSSITRA